MGFDLTKILKVFVVGVVTWFISDAIFTVIYQTVDNAIMSSGENINWLLNVLKFVAGFLAYDATSLAVAFITAIITFFKLKDID